MGDHPWTVWQVIPMDPGRVPSGSPDLDRLLNGGFEPGTITQFFGEPASGKSSACILAAVNCLVSGKSVVFIDTEGFSIERFRQIAGEHAATLAEHLYIYEPTDFDQQGVMIAGMDTVLRTRNVGLIIVDSATALYRTNLEKGRDAMQKLTRQIVLLLGFAKRYRIPGGCYQPGLHGRGKKYLFRAWRHGTRTHIESNHHVQPGTGERATCHPYETPFTTCRWIL